MWSTRRAFIEGVKDGFVQVELSSGITWEEHDDLNEAYDRGARLGEKLARFTFWRKPSY